ncbi:hypothetical protein CAOG_03540 [Capsaspora owczarzaki ATCC 30864]|uniref:Uncharacterized protein n=1 Tax=Capsaspora owczarzaki (strain ATCC 30864) TaxID=595528 RepID=A0A0D2UCA6_CAPO3|nr:hypothetical protein CAOG_03540 [Capsaspora owczarzaki ATCC 30864]KJE92616.1 hypothetical protein CAOG_003540 [Capsaspora owczarzaki ATCC 30864]|eukprot:XP_004348445.1 hypothetical protein CAOG_03540 [Capsaspora owczarzaki ATCC 30864]
MFPPWLVPVLSVFVGCCANVVFLEYIVRDDPAAGNLITVAQFAFVGLEGLVFHVRKGLLGSRTIPLRHYALLVALFFATSVVNNLVFGYRVSLPLHLIFRSGSLVTNMLLGAMLLGKRYSLVKILSVVCVSCGIAMCTIASANASSSGAQSDGSVEDLVIGVTLLVVSLFVSSLLGIYQELLHSWYGKSWRESLFYSHFLALPGFLVILGNLIDHWSIFNQSPRLSMWIPFPSVAESLLSGSDLVQMACLAPGPLSATAGTSETLRAIWNAAQPVLAQAPGSLALCEVTVPIPRLWVFLLLNVVTQYICVRGVFELTSVTNSLVVTLTVTLRKFASLLLSIVYFGNPFTSSHWIGSAMLFVGTLVFLDLTPWQRTQSPATPPSSSSDSPASTSSSTNNSTTSVAQAPEKVPMQRPQLSTSPPSQAARMTVLALFSVTISTLVLSFGHSAPMAMLANFLVMHLFNLLTKRMESVRTNAQLPSFALIAVRAFVGYLSKTRASSKTIIPAIQVQGTHLAVDPDMLRQYRVMCKYTTAASQQAESLCFLEIMSLPLAGMLLTHPDYPINAFGHIHVRTDVVQTRSLSFDDRSLRFDMQMFVDGFRWVEGRGLEIETITLATLSGSEDVVWKCATTLLVVSRSKKARSSTPRPPVLSATGISTWVLPANTGVKFAQLSGDWNLHHLYPFTSRLIGYNRPIAHGVYTLARATAELFEHRYGEQSQADAQKRKPTSTHPIRMVAEFKAPLFLPASGVELRQQLLPASEAAPATGSKQQAAPAGLPAFIDEEIPVKGNARYCSFAVQAATGEPHLRGIAYPL